MGPAKYINQLINKGKRYLDNNTLIVGDFKMSLSAMTDILSTTSPQKQGP